MLDLDPESPYFSSNNLLLLQKLAMEGQQQQNDIKMEDGTAPAEPNVSVDEAQEPKYGGFTRFEIELEFVQCLYVAPFLLLTSPFLSRRTR